MNAFADANDILFEDDNLAIDAFWRAAGNSESDGVLVRVVRSEPDQEISWRDARLVVGTVILSVRISDVPVLSDRDTFEIDEARYVVTGDPRRDDLQLMWRAEAKLQ